MATTSDMDSDEFQQALTALQARNVKDAERLFRSVLVTQPRHLGALNLLGILLMQLGRFAEAEVYLRQAAKENAGSDATLYNYGLVLKALHRPAEAFERFSEALKINAAVAQTWNNRGTVLNDLKRHGEAITDFDRAITLDANYTDAIFNKANALVQLRSYGDALAAYDRVLSLKPDLAEAWLGRGNVLAELKQGEQATVAYDQALALKPDLFGAWLGRGNCHFRLQQYDNALAAYDRALALNYDLAEAWLGRGNIFNRFKQYDEAVAAFDKALAIKPDLAEAWLGRGNVAFERKEFQDALSAYDKALALKPDMAKAWLCRGSVFTELRRYDDALAAYDGALALDAGLDYAAGARLEAKRYLCDWADIESDAARVLAAVRADKAASLPFGFLASPSSAADQLQCARRYVRDLPGFVSIWRGEIYSHDRIRVAYLSPDFNEHPVAHLTVGLFENHDRSSFAVTAVAYGVGDGSEVRRRIASAAEHFIDARSLTDQAVANLIRANEIDIVVDLAGFLMNNRFNVLARRPAPVQVNYAGYPATMGASCIDYIVADSTIIPEDHCAFYEEQVIWLPESFYVNDQLRPLSEHRPARKECGLPDEGFVFCAFNNSYKITAEMFDVWMRLLKKVDGSVLWLKVNEQAAEGNLRREAERKGVAPDRLIFAGFVASQADHFARYRQADLFLDTLPYNAHTTASDVLWSGVPVVTCLGTTFASRVAGSLLKSTGLDDLVTHSLEDYEALALRLALDRSALELIKERLERNRMICPLFDGERSTRQIETAYRVMWKKYQSGEPAKARTAGPQPIRIG